MNNHPGGWEIMKHAQGREVDRFLYGVQPIQVLNDIPAHSHTVSSLSLLGDPIAKYDKICIFEGI